MKALRALLIATIIVVLATWPALIRNGRLTAFLDAPVHAATLSPDTRGPAASNENEKKEQEENRNHNDNGNNNNDDDDDDGPPPPPPSPPQPVQSAPPTPTCSTPGQEMSFTSSDGRVSVRVFGSMTQSVKISIRMPVDPGAVPPTPGNVIGGLLFQVVAEACDSPPIPVLSSEANLGLRYSDGDASGRNEANFTIARLDTSGNQWRDAPKQANDPPNNFASATIAEMGFYVLYQR